VTFDTEPAARATADAGLAALGGVAGATRDALTYATAICLWHLGRFDSFHAAADYVRTVLDSGRALRRFESARD
jgi:anthranilate phosphoribosyltransferase